MKLKPKQKQPFCQVVFLFSKQNLPLPNCNYSCPTIHSSIFYKTLLSLLSFPHYLLSFIIKNSFLHQSHFLTMLKPILIILSLYISSSYAQSCTNYKFSSNQIFTQCSDLPSLNSFLHWNYDQSTKSVKMAYRHSGVSASRWVAWAVNPTGRGMVGAQALVAYQKSDGKIRAYTSPVTGYQTQLQEGELSFPVSDLTATYAGNEFIIFATLKLDNISSTVNQVWQEGPLSGDSPATHPTSGPNVQSTGNLNLLSGQTGTTSGALGSRIKKKNVSFGC